MDELQIVSPMTREIVAVGRKKHFFYKPITYADPITAPIFIHRDGQPWWLTDRKEAHTHIPYFADRAKYPIIKAGFTIVQEIVAEEVPGLITMHKDAPPPIDYRQTVEDMFTETGRTLRRIGQGLAFILTVGVLWIDPALILVVEVEDGQHVHIEVARWVH